MKRIDTLAQLKEEKRRLRLKVKTLEMDMQTDWEGMKLSLSPVNRILKGFNSSLSSDKPNFLGSTLNVGIDMLLRTTFLRNRGFLVKLIVPYLVKNFTGNYIKDHRGDIMGWFRQKISKVFDKGNGHDKYYDQSTADVNSATW